MRERKMSLVDELSDLRVEIARLRVRESALVALLDADPARQAAPGGRSGWPIQRQTVHAAAQ